MSDHSELSNEAIKKYLEASSPQNPPPETRTTSALLEAMSDKPDPTSKRPPAKAFGGTPAVANPSYKPKPLSEPHNILHALYTLEAHLRPVPTLILCKEYEKIFNVPIRHWRTNIERLCINDFMGLGEKETNMARLEEKGKKFVIAMDNRKKKPPAVQKPVPSPSKPPSIPKTSPKAPPSAKSAPPSKTPSSSSGRISLGNTPPPRSPSLDSVSEEIKNRVLPKEILGNSRCADKIHLVLNQGVFAMEEMEALKTKVEEEGGVKVTTNNFNTNLAFFWEANNKILDTFGMFVEGVGEDIGVLKLGVEDARSCKPKNFIILFEGPIPQQKKEEKDGKILLKTKSEIKTEKKEQEMEEFIFACRASGMNVVRTESRNETAIFLRKITWIIQKKLKTMSETGEFLSYYGNIDTLNEWFSNSPRYSLKNITTSCFMRIKGFSKQASTRICEKLQTLKKLYKKLSKLETFEEKLEFINWVLEFYGYSEEGSKILIWILFGKDYASFKMGSAWAKGIEQEVKGQCKEGKEEEEEGEEMEEEEEEEGEEEGEEEKGVKDEDEEDKEEVGVGKVKENEESEDEEDDEEEDDSEEKEAKRKILSSSNSDESSDESDSVGKKHKKNHKKKEITKSKKHKKQKHKHKKSKKSKSKSRSKSNSKSNSKSKSKDKSKEKDKEKEKEKEKKPSSSKKSSRRKKSAEEESSESQSPKSPSSENSLNIAKNPQKQEETPMESEKSDEKSLKIEENVEKDEITEKNVLENSKISEKSLKSSEKSLKANGKSSKVLEMLLKDEKKPKEMSINLKDIKNSKEKKRIGVKKCKENSPTEETFKYESGDEYVEI